MGTPSWCHAWRNRIRCIEWGICENRRADIQGISLGLDRRLMMKQLAHFSGVELCMLRVIQAGSWLVPERIARFKQYRSKYAGTPCIMSRLRSKRQVPMTWQWPAKVRKRMWVKQPPKYEHYTDACPLCGDLATREHVLWHCSATAHVRKGLNLEIPEHAASRICALPLCGDTERHAKHLALSAVSSVMTWQNLVKLKTTPVVEAPVEPEASELMPRNREPPTEAVMQSRKHEVDHVTGLFILCPDGHVQCSVCDAKS
eukprot:5831997-Amphidinium_carterae.1